MEISPLLLAKLLLYSFFWGIAAGIFYDACRIVRVLFGIRYSKQSFGGLFDIKLPIVKKRLAWGVNEDKGIKKFIKSTAVFLGDFASVLFAVCGLIVLNYSYNDGRFRFFTVAGLVFGFLIYYFTLGRLVMLVSEPAAFLVKYIFCAFFVILALPFKKIFQNVVKNIRKLHFLYSFTLEKKQKKVYNIEEKIYLLKLSKNGFVPKGFFDARERSRDD